MSWVGIVAVLSNLLASVLCLAPAKAVVPVDDILGPLVICTEHGDLVLEVNGEWHDRQRIDGVSDPNSGGNVVFLSPGVRLSYQRWSGFVSVGVPIVNDLNGLQAEPEWRVLTGMAVNF